MPRSDPAMKSLVTSHSYEEFGPTEYAIIVSIVGFALVCGLYIVISIFRDSGVHPDVDTLTMILMGSG